MPSIRDHSEEFEDNARRVVREANPQLKEHGW